MPISPYMCDVIFLVRSQEKFDSDHSLAERDLTFSIPSATSRVLIGLQHRKHDHLRWKYDSRSCSSMTLNQDDLLATKIKEQF